MSLYVHPTLDDMGVGYYLIWRRMAMYYLVMEEFFGGDDWMQELTMECSRLATDHDGIIYIQTFVERFYAYHALVDLELHRIVREIVSAY